MNARVEKKIREVQNGLVELHALMESIETRENNPAFQTAKQLFEKGYRLFHWGVEITDTSNYIELFLNGYEIGSWSDGHTRDTDYAFVLMDLEKTDKNDRVLYYLADLTEEEDIENDRFK